MCAPLAIGRKRIVHLSYRGYYGFPPGAADCKAELARLESQRPNGREDGDRRVTERGLVACPCLLSAMQRLLVSRFKSSSPRFVLIISKKTKRETFISMQKPQQPFRLDFLPLSSLSLNALFRVAHRYCCSFIQHRTLDKIDSEGTESLRRIHAAALSECWAPPRATEKLCGFGSSFFLVGGAQRPFSSPLFFRFCKRQIFLSLETGRLSFFSKSARERIVGKDSQIPTALTAKEAEHRNRPLPTSFLSKLCSAIQLMRDKDKLLQLWAMPLQNRHRNVFRLNRRMDEWNGLRKSRGYCIRALSLVRN